jgi:long-chain acyl-CoA synthetase
VAQKYAGQKPPSVQVHGDDLAFLAYTSGTTGPPKGAMNSHANVRAVTTSFAELAGITPGDVVFALAPLFHITGAVVIGALALTERTSLVFTGRFTTDVAVDALREHGVTYTIGSITAFNAMMNSEYATAEHFSTIKTLFSGGAPVPPSTVARFQERFGHYIHNAYGMTETSSAVTAVPPGTSAPVDPDSGTLSIGLPLPGVNVEVVDPEGHPLSPGSQGELVVTGPQVICGYWRKPEESEAALPEAHLRTGDSAIVDEQGWVYLVDRIKDQINVSGYKVWPREVEDVLYEHPAVLEAAVVGVPDEYQGESVAAYVSLKDGYSVRPDDLISFTRDRLAPYKRPKAVEVLADLPKTQTGKIRRRALRDQHTEARTA